jgi:hypothetical protein
MIPKRREVWIPKIADGLMELEDAIDRRKEIEPCCDSMRAAALMAGTPVILDCVNAAERHYARFEYQRAHDLVEDCLAELDAWTQRASASCTGNFPSSSQRVLIAVR